MTRFARAKGSKSSNERLPNEATPWHVMKQQLEDNISTKSSQPQKAKTAKQLLNEKDDPFYYDTTGNVNNDWAEFERPKPDKSKKHTAKEEIKSSVTPESKKKKNKQKGADLPNGSSNIQNSTSSDAKTTPKNKAKKRNSNVSAEADSTEVEATNNVESNSSITQKKKSKKRKSDISTAESVENSMKVEAVNNAEADSKVTPKKKSAKQSSDTSCTESVKDSVNVEAVNNGESDGTVTPKKKTKKRKSDVFSAESTAKHLEKIENGTNEASVEPKKKKKKKKDKRVESSTAESTEVGESTKEKKEDENVKVEKNVTSRKMSKRQKRNQKRKNKIASNEATADGVSSGEKKETPISGGFDAAGNDWSSNVNFGKQQRFEKKLSDPSNGDSGQGGRDFKKPANRANGQGINAVKRKAPKIRDDKEHKRRKPDVGSIKCTINGMDVEIVKYDGFPVKQEDAERLKELRQQMVLKGIPKSEIDAAMKLERRKAEKSLARVRKQVCFHCRKAGHNLSDCPELGEGESATGICFKCGSTEHTHFECRVTKKQEYGFASCFICREQGHIAKQCPDNPKGLYPQGGSCKICGDVTHLRKDCPDLTKEKEESAMTLSTIAEHTLESLDEDITKKSTGDDGKKAKGKVVKF